MVDVTDSKSVGLIPRVGSSPTTGTKIVSNNSAYCSEQNPCENRGFVF